LPLDIRGYVIQPIETTLPQSVSQLLLVFDSQGVFLIVETTEDSFNLRMGVITCPCLIFDIRCVSVVLEAHKVVSHIIVVDAIGRD